MVEIKLFLFGQPQLSLNGQAIHLERRKAFALLAYLALAKHRQQRDVLATLLWPELDHDHAYAALRSTLSSITTALKSDWLLKDRSSLALNLNLLWVDVLAFQKYLSQFRAHKHENAPLCADCLSAMNQALELYRADFMAGFSPHESNEYDEWQSIQAEALRRELAYILQRLAEHHGKVGDFELALSYAKRWLELDNLHEAAHRLLMRLYAASGQKNLALRQYQHCVEILDEELATLPDDETQQLYLALQSENSFSMSAVNKQETVSILPVLPSLVVGRETVFAELKARLRQTSPIPPVIIIQGWPGIGKTTTVSALAHDPEILQLFPDGILWASLGESPNLLAELSNWSLALGLLNREDKIENISKQLANALKTRRCLLLLDDIWHLEHATPFKVGGANSATIITSRLNDVAQALAPTTRDIYRLPLLSEDAALDLLGRLSPETISEYPQEARSLVRDLEGLPLAIQVAGRLLHAEARLGWGVGNLLEELRNGTALLNAQVPSDLQRFGQASSPTIDALLKRSTDALDTAMRERFALLSLFAPKPASFDLGALATLWRVTDPKPFVRILVNRGLLEPSSAGRFQMHALLVLHARSLLQEMNHASSE